MKNQKVRIKAKVGPRRRDLQAFWEWKINYRQQAVLVVTSMTGKIYAWNEFEWIPQKLKIDPKLPDFVIADVFAFNAFVFQGGFLIPRVVIDAAPESVKNLLKKTEGGKKK